MNCPTCNRPLDTPEAQAEIIAAYIRIVQRPEEFFGPMWAEMPKHEPPTKEK